MQRLRVKCDSPSIRCAREPSSRSDRRLPVKRLSEGAQYKAEELEFEATYRHGILEVVLPVREGAKPHGIEVKAGTAQ